MFQLFSKVSTPFPIHLGINWYASDRKPTWLKVKWQFFGLGITRSFRNYGIRPTTRSRRTPADGTWELLTSTEFGTSSFYQNQFGMGRRQPIVSRIGRERHWRIATADVAIPRPVKRKPFPKWQAWLPSKWAIGSRINDNETGPHNRTGRQHYSFHPDFLSAHPGSLK